MIDIDALQADAWKTVAFALEHEVTRLHVEVSGLTARLDSMAVQLIRINRTLAQWDCSGFLADATNKRKIEDGVKIAQIEEYVKNMIATPLKTRKLIDLDPN